MLRALYDSHPFWFSFMAATGAVFWTVILILGAAALAIKLLADCKEDGVFDDDFNEKETEK